MADPIVLYNAGFLAIADGSIRWGAAANIAAVLLRDTYVPAAGHSTFADISAHQVTDVDYSAQAVASRQVTLNSGEVRYTSAAVSYGSDVTIAARYLALVVGNAGSLAAGDKLIGYVDFGATVSSTNSVFSFTPPANGWFRIAPEA